MLARVMIYMSGPHPTDPVTSAMNPVIFEIIYDKAQWPSPPGSPPMLVEAKESIFPGIQKDDEEKAAK
jgi:hypothetical protein